MDFISHNLFTFQLDIMLMLRSLDVDYYLPEHFSVYLFRKKEKESCRTISEKGNIFNN